jgi:hypothetical protein
VSGWRQQQHKARIALVRVERVLDGSDVRQDCQSTRTGTAVPTAAAAGGDERRPDREQEDADSE